MIISESRWSSLESITSDYHQVRWAQVCYHNIFIHHYLFGRYKGWLTFQPDNIPPMHMQLLEISRHAHIFWLEELFHLIASTARYELSTPTRVTQALIALLWQHCISISCFEGFQISLQSRCEKICLYNYICNAFSSGSSISENCTSTVRRWDLFFSPPASFSAISCGPWHLGNGPNQGSGSIRA